MSDRLSRALVIAASALFLAVLVAFLIFRWVVPFDGANDTGAPLQLSSGMPVQTLQSYPSGLQDGDIVLAVNGISVETWAGDALSRDLPRPQWVIGGTADYTILRDGQELAIAQPLGRYPLGRVLLDNWGGWVFAIGNLLVALFAFSRKPDEPALRVYLLAAAILMVASTFTTRMQVSDIVNGIGLLYGGINGVIVYPLLLILFTHFMLVFPRPQPWLANRRWVIPILYLLPALVMTLAAAVLRPMSSSIAHWVDSLGVAANALALLYSIFILIAAISSFVTARDPVSRAQIRWVLVAIIFIGVFGLATDTIPRSVWDEPLVSGNIVSVVALLMPVAIAIAILRFRLFNIDFIIRRTTQYAIVTGLLVLVYFGSVVFLQRLFATVTGQTSTVAVVLSTLLIAALFLPVRRRVQDVVDRRFFRQKYDAEKVLTEFAATVRDETDLDALTAELERVIQETMQPEFVSVWLAPEVSSTGGSNWQVPAASPGKAVD